MFALSVVALLAASPTTVASIKDGNALTLPAARHLLRLDPQNGKPATWLLALQQDGASGRWLGWWRSDDEAHTWTWYAPIQNTSVDRDTVDTVAVGMDIALVYSFEGPTLSGSTAHGVWFQWWRWNGNTDWVPQAPVNVFTPASSATAYARAEIVVDSQGRIWVWAQRLNADGSFTMVISVSTDGGATFAAQPVMDSFATRPGGRIMAIGGNRLMLLYSAQGGQPGYMRIRSDADALSAWSARQLVFSEGIYHGAGLSAVDDGSGGVHLVYKDSAEELRYRHYDGASWGSPQLIESAADWALQPAITRVGTTIVIFWNRMIAANTDYQVYYRTLSNGSLSAPQLLDGTGGFKGYPAAAETLPSTVPTVACAYGNTPDASSGGVASLVFAPTPGGIASPPPPPPPPSNGVLFSDDFNRSNSADLGPNWNVLAGVWFDNGTAAQTDSHPLNRATVANISCADCRIDAQMVNFGGGDSMLELRVGSTGRYALALRTDGVLEIRRYSSGGVTLLGSVASGITDLKSWNSFSFVAQGTAPVSLTGYVNGTPKVTATDASSAALTAPGAAGMAAVLAGILFDNFTLSGISSGGGGAPDGGVGDGGVGDGGLGDGGSPASGDWPMYRHDLGGTSNGAGSISASQAASLKVLFKVSIPASVANPVVASGTLFVASGSGKILALDPRTGATRWSRSTGVSSLGTCATYSQGAVGAAAVVGSTVFAPGGDGRVYAFDTATGNQLWATQIANTANDEFLWSSAIPIGGGVYVGVATLEEAACSLVVPGRLVGLDQATGAVTSTWWSDVNQGAGGGIWTSAAFDQILGRIFVTTGNVANGVSATSEPWQQAFVSIDPSTAHTADSYQPIQTDFSTDWDFGASPTLFDASGRHLIAAANKNGLVYALERTNLSGGVLWTSPISGSGDSPDLGVGSIVSPTFANGLLFVAGGATTDGYPGAISALDPATGTTVWKMHPDGFVLPAMAAAGGVLAAGVSHSDGTGRIYVLDQTSGAAVFTLATAGKIFGEPSWANGVLYVVDLAGYLYALSP